MYNKAEDYITSPLQNEYNLLKQYFMLSSL